MRRHIPLEVGANASGLRLDQALAKLCPELSRSEARRLISRGGVFLARKRVKVASRVVREGQRIDIYPRGVAFQKETSSEELLEIPVLRESAAVLVIDKPSGLMSAPTPESDQHDLKSHLEKKYGPLYLIHRLDRPTSGLMLLARTPAAAAALSAQLADRTLSRKYRAILGGHIGAPGEAVHVSTPVGDKEARTDFHVLSQKQKVSLVTATLSTGRTHQIRVHAAELRAPVLGDSKYGRALLRGFVKPPRLALHAEALTFVEPETEQPVTVTSPFPENLQSYFESLC